MVVPHDHSNAEKFLLPRHFLDVLTSQHNRLFKCSGGAGVSEPIMLPDDESIAVQLHMLQLSLIMIINNYVTDFGSYYILPLSLF